MQNKSLSFTTIKGFPVRLDRSGKTVKVLLQEGDIQHKFVLVDVVSVGGDEYVLVVDTGSKIRISRENAEKAKALLILPGKSFGIGKWIAIGAGVLFGLYLIGSLSGSKDKPATGGTESSSKQADSSSSQVAASSASSIATNWRYQTETDTMSGKTSHSAAVDSENTVNFSFPYNGAQHGELTLRKHPRYGNDVILSITKGQFLCNSYDGCSVLVKFDDKPPVKFTAAEAADHSTELLFIRNYKRFSESLQSAKRVVIEAPVYQEGSPEFEFDVSQFDAKQMAGS
ncbi:hypothetical protein AEAC466_01275 [Asticcacaulis sp. AC466]|uniref:hypothetical protein n=1 Tax=Asticcacaulis sp. AC466 TaxID=1282362 RepID=UPI0003C3B952|nr:hypothetical protein [Asticcacaulis sp. AC466]ESQ85837.1 hypothetical protein AEAC466_01275 [Asticcacaulis sp. AC466]